MTLTLNFTDISHNAFEKLGYDDKTRQMVMSNVPRNLFTRVFDYAVDMVDKIYTPKAIAYDCGDYIAMNDFMGENGLSFSW